MQISTYRANPQPSNDAGAWPSVVDVSIVEKWSTGSREQLTSEMPRYVMVPGTGQTTHWHFMAGKRHLARPRSGAGEIFGSVCVCVCLSGCSASTQRDSRVSQLHEAHPEPGPGPKMRISHVPMGWYRSFAAVLLAVEVGLHPIVLGGSGGVPPQLNPLLGPSCSRRSCRCFYPPCTVSVCFLSLSGIAALLHPMHVTYAF